MEKILLYDWKPGFNKAGLNKLLRAKANYSLSSAIKAIGKLLEKETLEIEIESSERAEAFLKEALNLGVIGEIKNVQTTTITVLMPETVLSDLERVAPLFGFSSCQPLIQHYVDQGLRVDLERLKKPTMQSSTI
jgi:hypothetical protein